uniref:Uncharacterized protein n=1 Tax=Glossina brevipalpis TaxID=37001 RepID=A0A1A9WFX0_9MUSC
MPEWERRCRANSSDRENFHVQLGQEQAKCSQLSLQSGVLSGKKSTSSGISTKLSRNFSSHSESSLLSSIIEGIERKYSVEVRGANRATICR